jgi:large repetitive protein
MAQQRSRVWGFVSCLFSLVLLGCSNGSGSVEGDGSPAQSPTFTISVMVSGLAGDGLVLQNNGANDVPVAANGKLTFGNAIARDGAYNVTVLAQPTNPTQSCTVVGGVGTVATEDVTNVSVTCTTPDAQNFAVRGTVTGLTGAGLVLQNNAGDNLAISADGEFSFATPLATGTAYAVTVLTQPSTPAQTCSVNNNAGTVGIEDVTNVAVACSVNSFSVSASVSGLRGGGLQLGLNGTETLPVTADGTYAFTQLVASGAPYNVSVLTHPTSPKQTCVPNSASGVIESANVTNVTVTCTTENFSIGGTVKGLAGRGFVLLLNGSNNLSITSSGSFQFGTTLPSGSQYSVTVLTEPSNPTQVCSLKNATGALGSANVTNVDVTCVTQKFKVGGAVTGLLGRDFRLRIEAGNVKEDLSIAANGSFTFTPDFNSGTRYTVSVQKQPSKPRQACTLANPTGTVGAANVTNINVTCPAPTAFAVGGTISGLAGQGLLLQNNGADNLAVAGGATSFEFPALVAIGSGYNVTVAAQPTNPWQDCTVAAGSGTVSNDDITNVAIGCTTKSFKVGGTVSGLAFPSPLGVRLQLNGAETLDVFLGTTTFMFPNALLSGTPYTVTVAPPSGCSVAGGTGVVGGSDVAVTVTC